MNSNNNNTNFINSDAVTFDDSASGNFTITIPVNVSPTSMLVNNSSNNYTFSGAGGIVGTTALTKSGTGTLTLSTPNSYSGGTTVNGGTVTLNTGSSLGSGPVTINAGTINAVTGAINNTVSITGGGVLSITSQDNLGLTNPININGGTLRVTSTYSTGANQQVITVGASGATIEVAFSDPNGLAPGAIGFSKNGDSITGSGNLIKTGPGWVNFGSAGGTGFTGAIEVRDGVFSYTSNRLTNSGNLTVLAGGTHALLDTVTFTLAAPYRNDAGGILILNGDGYQNGGAFRHQLDEAGSANAGVSIPITLNTTSRFTMTAGTRGSRTAADTVTTTFTAIISGNGGLIKDGEGTMIVTGANTYTGATTVNAGTLIVNGNNSAATGAITVANTATLRGTGTLGRATTVQSGGTIRGGTGTATTALTTQNVTINSGGILAANVAASGTNSSLSVGANTLNLQTGSIVRPVSVTGFTNTAPCTYNLATFTSGSTLQLDGTGVADGFVFGSYVQGSGATGAVVIDVSQLGLTLSAGDTFWLTRTGDAFVLNFAPVPEPATIFGVSSLLLSLGYLVRRRRLA